MIDLLFKIKKEVDISENTKSLDTKQLFEFEKEYKEILDEGAKNYPIIETIERSVKKNKIS